MDQKKTLNNTRPINKKVVGLQSWKPIIYSAEYKLLWLMQ